MKNIFVGTFIAAALFAAPIYPSYAQVASTTEEQVASLREELINLLMQLITQLQAQIDSQMVKDQEQDEEIAVIKSTGGSRSTTVEEAPVFEAPVDTIAEARARVGQIEASVALGEENLYFSVSNYLDADTVSFEANSVASSTDGGCSAISGSSHRVCAQSVAYPIMVNDLVISVTVNGVEKTLVLEPGKKSIVRVNWAN